VSKCAPYDDQGHRWWLGAIDGGTDRSGGYGRFQAGPETGKNRGRRSGLISFGGVVGRGVPWLW
jgi:hypothetical protein